MLVLVENWEMLKKYASITKLQFKSIENFLKLIGTGRCTVILKTKGLLSKKLNPEGEKIGFRITSHPLAKKLLRFAQVPLVATSANLSGQPAVTNWRKLSFFSRKGLKTSRFYFGWRRYFWRKPPLKQRISFKRNSWIVDILYFNSITIYKNKILPYLKLEMPGPIVWSFCK